MAGSSKREGIGLPKRARTEHKLLQTPMALSAHPAGAT